ncbi:MerR family transcriptional regulator [Pseudozobellia thermophila]|uniref:B12 binding domain-containing protein n=1 Tax=Pseudozobellia thermophila TaxID=192903 RepID=A0A1M6I1W6_9FLAO|nr:MerR family transcriptional regulator [Pseudozobellia thermophila]SHJ28425.1 B12 binding domain-containing protein [Pseudozobellia thermophila]
MNNIKKRFSIRDLENLSGIKAHTIRIWEKRYNLLTPERTSTNIRTYSLSSLQKLLNITLLYKSGHKISKIAKIPEQNIPSLVQKIVTQDRVDHHSINSFKLAMMNFDQSLFIKTYDKLRLEKSFDEIFKEVLIPLLTELGLLWQTDTISPPHEHFITNLIKQKIVINTEKLQGEAPTKTDRVFVPFLPDNEIHEIGLLYLNYEIVKKGYRSIYLGQTVPLENLTELLNYFDNIRFISYFTVVPSKDYINNYIADFEEMARPYPETELWLLGRQTEHIDKTHRPKMVKTFTSIEEVTTCL